MMPKATPTIMNRLFIPKLGKPQLKTDCLVFGKNLEECFKVKIVNLIHG